MNLDGNYNAADCRGAKGDRGDAGPQGERGPQGQKGISGYSVEGSRSESVAGGTTQSIEFSCSTGKVVVTYGWSVDSPSLIISSAIISQSGTTGKLTVGVTNTDASAHSVTVQLVCADAN